MAGPRELFGAPIFDSPRATGYGGSKMRLDRRTFFLTSGALLAQAPSKQLTAGVIGSGGRGRYLESVFQRDAGVRITAVCDVYEPNLEAGLSAAFLLAAAALFVLFSLLVIASERWRSRRA